MSARRAIRTMRATPWALVGLLGGCMNLSGIGGSSRYACGAPEGVSCQSVSATYAQGARGAKEKLKDSSAIDAKDGEPHEFKPFQRAPASTAPLRTPPRILRLWFKAWEDGDRDLVDQGYVYVQVDPGGWQLESWQRQIRTPYQPIRAPQTSHADDRADPRPSPSSISINVPALPAQTPMQGQTPTRSLPAPSSVRP